MSSAEPAAPCSIASTLDAIGDRWTLLILRDVFRGVRRFDQIQRDLGIARNILTDRLNRLVANDVLQTVVYQQKPVRHEYRLTEKGRDLSASLVALMHWGDRWYADGEPPVVLVHDECGHPIEHVVRCTGCDMITEPTAIGSRPGPGHVRAN